EGEMTILRTGIPQAGQRWLRGLALGAGAVLLTAATLTATDDGAVVSLSVVPTSGRAQVVIGVDGNVSVKDFTLRSPERIVVDITGATLSLHQRTYDRVARGGVIDVRTNQFKPNVVRVVLSLSGPRHYQVVRGKGAVMVSVDGGGDFAAWRASGAQALASAPAPSSPLVAAKPIAAEPDAVAPRSQVTVSSVTPSPMSQVDYVPQAPQGERRISVVFDKASIVDVLAQFAAFSHRTIIPAKSVASAGDITAEIKDKPWDVAMKVILNANGYDAVEDPNGIIIVNTLEALAARPRLEALTTQTLRFNYTSAIAVADAIKGRLTRDCGQQPSGPAGTAPAGGAQAPTSQLNCPVRGAVTADSLTNSVSITDAPTAIKDIIDYAKTLDVRQPQVNIKAKIILVDRTQLEGLGLKYDIGTRSQHFNDVVQHRDSLGAPETGNVILLGGNTLSAIANATSSVPGAALNLVYSAALGAFDFTTFLSALQEIDLLDVQAEPSVTTLNYRTASLTAGTQVPVRTTEQGAGANSAGQLPQVTVSMRSTGIVLNVTPYITNNRQVKMRVHAENSDVQFVSDQGAVFPQQIIENELLGGDGETAVMGGLTQTSVRVTKSGIPLLVDLPLIGKLFGVTNRQETKRDLLILITPHIVDEGDMTMEPRRQP
ncbi:MAG TPA: AMIN domain-containing protein, partial [Gemmatimonadaceae bacterium]